MKMGNCYLVATPIGNLKDISQRAIDILSAVDVIAAEDTRKTGMLLKYLNISHQSKMLSFYEENELQRIPELLTLLKSGLSVALVSNSGTPTISDPGFKLVRECRRMKIGVIHIPGPSSTLAALSASGLPTDKFFFLGFLPKKSSQRKKIFGQIKECSKYIPSTVIFFESPFRLVLSLIDLKEFFGNIDVVVAREITKIHEEIEKEKVSSLIEKFSSTAVIGEITVLFNPTAV